MSPLSLYDWKLRCLITFNVYAYSLVLMIFDNSLVRAFTLLQELMADCNASIKKLGIGIMADLDINPFTRKFMSSDTSSRSFNMFFAIGSKCRSTRKPAKDPRGRNNTNSITLPT